MVTLKLKVSKEYLNTSCFLTRKLLSFPAKVITRCMEAAVSYFTDDATAERNWIFNRQSHVFDYYTRHFCTRVFRALPLRPPHRTLLLLPFPYFLRDHCYSPTSLHPKLPHAVPGLTGCVAAASAEITTQHPGREQPADGIDYLYCQNN